MRGVHRLPSFVALLPSAAALMAAAAGGCQLVAGIENLELTGSQEAGFAPPFDASSNEPAAETGPADRSDASTPDSALDGGPCDRTVPADGTAPADRAAPLDAADASAPPLDAPVDGAQDAGGWDAPEPDTDSASDDGESDAALPTQLIDDLESDDGHILPVDGRSGSWFTYNDGTDGGVQTPSAPFLPVRTMPPLGTSMFSAETTGSGFASFAGMGFTLNDPPTGPNAGVMSPYDASAFLGIVFDARVGAGSVARVRVGFPDVETNASGNSFGEFLTLTTEWTQEVVYFKDTKQLNGLGPLQASLDTSDICSIIFQVDAVSSPVTFDLWIDNVAFITP